MSGNTALQRGQRLLITGASGLIGRNLLTSLERKHEICALDRLPPETSGAPVTPRIEWIQADVSKRDELSNAVRSIRAGGDIDLVVHLAGYYDLTGRNAPEYQLVNVDGTRNVLELSRELHPRRFVFASSVVACDFTHHPRTIDERTPPDGVTYYARSKRSGEEMTNDYSSEFPVCVVRFGAVFTDWCEYGPLYYFLSRWLSTSWRRRILAGRGESAVPYLHARDAVSFVSRLLDRHERLSNTEILIASADGATSHRELQAAATACHYGRPVRPILLPSLICRSGLWGQAILSRISRRPVFERPWMGRYIDRRIEVDASRTRDLLDWSPTESLHILQRMPLLIQHRESDPAEWRRRNGGADARIRG
jgi:nucleoside-diphosphate-sugar epimerase